MIRRVDSGPWATSAALAAVVAAAAVSGVWLASDGARADGEICYYDRTIEVLNGYWAVFNTSSNCDAHYLLGLVYRNGQPIPGDQPRPSVRPWAREDGVVIYEGYYRGDLLVVPYCVDADGNRTDAGCASDEPGALNELPDGTLIRTWMREGAIPAWGGRPPPPIANPPSEVVFSANDDHRVVLVNSGSGQEYYREWRVGDQWYRSNSYGGDLLQAQWNAWLISQGRRLIPIAWLLTDPPPAADD